MIRTFQRVAVLLQLTCVESCCGGAITLSPGEGAPNIVREKAAKRLAAAERLL